MGDRTWLKEIEEVVRSGERRVREVERDRERRLLQQRKALKVCMRAVRSRLDDAVTIIKKHAEPPEIIEDETSIYMKMPGLSEVNRADLLFVVAPRYDENTGEAVVSVEALRVDAGGREEIGRCDQGDAGGFAAGVIRDFLEGWYKRRLSDELNKEREWKLKITFGGEVRPRPQRGTR